MMLARLQILPKIYVLSNLPRQSYQIGPGRRHFHRLDKKDWRRAGTHGIAAYAPAVVERFGGVGRLVEALAKVGHPKDRACIYRWLYPYPKGTGGRIPRKAWIHIQEAAKHVKISLSGIRTIPVRENKNVRGVWARLHK